MACDNTRKCDCPNVNCGNHGKCCACVAAHKGGSELPFCLRK
jgi:hypothetical protein